MPLADAGFHVIVPDGRGYNLSDKPARVRDYAVAHLVSDVLALCEHLDLKRVFLAGHDWGAGIAWAFAAAHPEKVERLAILNVPHPAVFLPFLLTHPHQLRRSWYMFFFQIPRLAEKFLSAHDYRAGLESLTKTSRPGAFSEADLEEYRQAWKQPGGLAGMINWYRALFRNPASSRIGRINPPVLILWGKQDAFLLPQLAEKSLPHCRDAKLVWFDDATHWLHHEQPDAVNKALLRFFRG
jgi:pimeloyl-ACP methyl ester carboxylesterase